MLLIRLGVADEQAELGRQEWVAEPVAKLDTEQSFREIERKSRRGRILLSFLSLVWSRKEIAHLGVTRKNFNAVLRR